MSRCFVIVKIINYGKNNNLFSLFFLDERPRDDDGRRAGVCHPGDHHRQAALRSSRQNHRIA